MMEHTQSAYKYLVEKSTLISLDDDESLAPFRDHNIRPSYLLITVITFATLILLCFFGNEILHGFCFFLIPLNITLRTLAKLENKNKTNPKEKTCKS